MKHFASGRFWAAFNRLPEEVQGTARKSFRLLKSDPRHPSLHFKRVGHLKSVRVDLQYRALGIDVEGGILWFWIGSHADYDRLVG